MTANAVTGGSRSPGPNPMAGLQRQAFGFGGTSSNVQLALSVVGPIAAVLLTWGRVHWLGFLAAVLLPTPALLAILALRHRSRWAAQDVLFWLNDVAAADWQQRTGSRMPRNSVEANAWLGGRAESDIPLDCWVAALLMAGLVDEAREATARLPIGTPSELHRRLDLELAADAAAGRAIDVAAANEALRRDLTASATVRTVHLAYHAAIAAVSRGLDGPPTLASARPSIGRLGARPTIRMAMIRFRFAVISAIFGAWLLAAVVVGLAASGGVFWL